VKRLALEPAIWVQVAAVQGSGPREVGAWMAVFADGQVGTIGGGHLEWMVTQHARAALTGAPLHATQRHALGPSLGQCCGGVVHLALECVRAEDVQRLSPLLAPVLQPVALFGGGHVGQALVKALALLPFALTWIDSRDEIFPSPVSPGVRCEHSDPVQAAVRDLAPRSAVLIMSFSHAEDLDVLAECLLRQRTRADLRWIGLIGSKSKWASFQHRLATRGFAEAEWSAVACPIGLPGIVGKQPSVIAASVAAQLLQVCRL
jgi:xanthine dehydrogenase accessory factor